MDHTGAFSQGLRLEPSFYCSDTEISRTANGFIQRTVPGFVRSRTVNCFSGGRRMRLRAIVLALVAFFAASTLATAQQATGEIYGKVTDASGAVLPGVTV